MHILQHGVLLAVNQACLLVGLFPPKHENDALCVPRDRSNHVFSELLPALLLVRVGLALLHCEDRVEKEDALLRPRAQVTVDRAGSSEVHIWVILEGAVDLEQTWRRLNLPRYGEAHAHGLVVLDVGVLAHNDNFEVRKSRLIEGIKDELLRRKASGSCILTLHVLEQVDKGSALQMLAQCRPPRAKRRSERLDVGEGILR